MDPNTDEGNYTGLYCIPAEGRSWLVGLQPIPMIVFGRPKAAIRIESCKVMRKQYYVLLFGIEIVKVFWNRNSKSVLELK